MKINSKILIIFSQIIFALLISNCKKTETDGKPPILAGKVLPIVAEVKINKVNFYFENSASMNGYLDGKDFRKSIAEILYNSENEDSLETYFVNSAEHKTTDILNKIRSKQINVGDNMSSDHKFIFTNAINHSSNNNLSIVITDGIYSMKGGNINDVEVDIQNSFKRALAKNKIETVVLKMASNFDGQYYSEKCRVKGGLKINQERPYYILLFGNKGVIDKALKNLIKVEDLGGYQNQARFFLTKEMKVDYSVLLNGEEKKGSFKPEGNSSPMKSIKETEKHTPNGKSLKDAYLQFAIAVDFSKTSIPEEYLVEKVNYTIDTNTDYEIVEIKKINSTSHATKEDVKTRLKNATHLIIVKGKSQLFGELNIHLNINTPSWIAQTGSVDDCDIRRQTSNTIAFDKLMNGISGAYEEINDKNEYLTLSINIKT